MTGEKSGSEAEELRGLGKLAVDATIGITDLSGFNHSIVIRILRSTNPFCRRVILRPTSIG